MLTLAIILGFLLLNVLLAYVPIILIIGYNLRPKQSKDELRDRYLSDEISTAEYVRELDEQYRGKTHIPLRGDE